MRFSVHTRVTKRRPHPQSAPLQCARHSAFRVNGTGRWRHTPQPTWYLLGRFWWDVSEQAWKFYKSVSPLSDLAIKAVDEL